MSVVTTYNVGSDFSNDLTLFQNSSFREAVVCDTNQLIVKLTKWTELSDLFVTKTGRNTNK